MAVVDSAFARAAVWNAIGFFGLRGFVLLSLACAARFLEAQEFGRLSIIYLTVTVFQTFSEGGLSVVVTSRIAAASDHRGKDAAAIVGSARVSTMVLGCLMVGILLTADKALGNVVFAGEESASLRLVVLILIISASTGNMSAAALNGFRNFRHVAFANIAGGVVSLVGVYYGVNANGILGSLIGLAVGSMVRSAIGTCFLIVETRASGAMGFPFGKWLVTKQLFAQGFPAVVTAVIWLPTQLAALHIMTSASGGYSEAGYFSVASQVFSMLLILSSIVAQVSLPFLSKDVKSSGSPLVRGKLRRLVISVGVTTILVSTVVLLCVNPVIAFFGPAYEGARSTVVVMVICAVVASPQGVLTNFLVAHERLWPRLWVNVAAGATLIVVTYVLGKEGAFGLALAHLSSWLVRTVGIFVQIALLTNRQNSLDQAGV
ncbi:oligosaccharide flippase family protein [Mesorhizobium sp. M0220]|uniref:oligosaccharide flippase family protein n=1 Tax=Mesorhizobium sp. M0220 TaxID=2956920 RepID=UPI0033359FDC